MTSESFTTEHEGLPPIFSPQRFFLDAPKQPRGTCFVLNTDFQLAMAEIERLRERNAWLEEYVKACDNEIKRARGALPTVDVGEKPT